MNRFSHLSAGLFTFTSFFLASCDLPSTTQTEIVSEEKPVVAILADRTTHFGKALEFGANHSANNNGLRLLWQDSIQPDDFEQQITVIQNLIHRRVDGMIIVTQNEIMIRKAVQAAKDQGIPVLLIDSPPLSNTESHGELLSVVATDQSLAGRLAAEEMAKLLQGKGRVAIIRYSPLSWKTEYRENAFLTQIRTCPDIEVVGHDLYAGTDVRRAREKMTHLLQLYAWGNRSKLDGIFISDESTACEMLPLIDQAKVGKKLYFVAFGTDDSLRTGMLTYRVDALFAEQPVRMGQLAVDTMAELLRGQTTVPFLDSGIHRITIDNLYSPYTQALIQMEMEEPSEILLNDSPGNHESVDADENEN